MYPRFLQLFLNNQIALGEPFNDVYVTPTHTKVGDEAVYTREDDRVVTAATTAASLEAEQESEVNTSRSGEDSMEHQDDLTDFVPPTPHDSPLLGGHTPGSHKDLVIKRLQKKVKRLEKKQRARTLWMKLFKIGTSKKKTLDKENVSKQGRDESNKIKELNLSDKGSGETKVFDYTTTAEKDVNVAEPVSTAGDAVNAASVIPDVSVASLSTSTTGDIFEDEMTTIADTLMAIRSIRPRTTSVLIHNVEEEPRRATPLPTVQIQDKSKGKMMEPKPTSKKPIKAQIQRDVEIAQRKRFFAAQTTEQIKNKPPTRAQLRNKMVTYLKHMESSKKGSRTDHDKDSVKKKKLKEDDAEKEELRACLDIVLVDDISVNVESLATKYLIVDWKTHPLTENMMYYPIIRANGSFKNYKILIEMCDDFDRKDIIDLYILVKERMLNRRLEIDHESEMAFELIRLIKT
uniref:Uncharacterized protein n=1 Tax=Tanacetum cinerariifolium TaxID=118510 RepID=A0A6L2JER9_TANCI|nr:hypothetical protein [Tanacetum cinerariifolium]